MEHLVDHETMAKLEALSPKVASTTPTELRLVLNALAEKSVTQNERYGMDDKPYWIVKLEELGNILPNGLQGKQLGTICRRMALYLKRQNDGYWVAWNKAQLDILQAYFGRRG